MNISLTHISAYSYGRKINQLYSYPKVQPVADLPSVSLADIMGHDFEREQGHKPALCVWELRNDSHCSSTQLQSRQKANPEEKEKQAQGHQVTTQIQAS